MVNKLTELYQGKAKTLFTTDNNAELIMLFRNDTSAFDGEKVAKLRGKGRINNYFNANIMQLLEDNGVQTGFIKLLSEQESLVKNLNMLPVECVVRNYTAGSITRRYGIDSGMELVPPMFEFFLKDDARHDPLITEQHIIAFDWATANEVTVMREYSLKVNNILKDFFEARGLILVDFKLEFGRFNNELYLGDEFTPDGCRIWDQATGQVYDKDIFRQDLGDVLEGYSKAAEKLGFGL
jgi:phosphoribosylaminoimidazole-succinocarboxamide synthase